MADVVHHCGTGPGEPDLMFFCPACLCGHSVWTQKTAGNGAKWTWNGSLEKPTFEPSLLVIGSKFTEAGWADYQAWVAAGYPDRNGKPIESVETRCHSYVKDGMIQFLGDCTHALRGKTVPLEPF